MIPTANNYFRWSKGNVLRLKTSTFGDTAIVYFTTLLHMNCWNLQVSRLMEILYCYLVKSLCQLKYVVNLLNMDYNCSWAETPQIFDIPKDEHELQSPRLVLVTFAD